MTRSPTNHPLFARFYAWLSPRMEAGGVGEQRDRLLAGLSGRVVDVGVGNGLNFAHYPPEVTSVTALEPERHLRAIAMEKAAQAPIRVELVAGVAERLPVLDGTFDAGVASHVLCSVEDPEAALRELHRVIKPGGRLRFLEHVRARTGPLLRAQRVVDATIWPALFAGCHTARDTPAVIEDAGFEIETMDRFRFPEGGIPLPTAPHVLGEAVRR